MFYNWNKYVHRNNPEQVISRDDYKKLSDNEKKEYNVYPKMQVFRVLNVAQTNLQEAKEVIDNIHILKTIPYIEMSPNLSGI